jgi:hypothetical protein
MAAVLALQITRAPSTSKKSAIILFQIFLLGVSLRFTVQLIFPGLIGMDPWEHQQLTNVIIATQHLPTTSEFAYDKLPIMQLFLSSASDLTGLGYRLVTMLSLSFLQSPILALFTYLIGKDLVNSKVGLMGALLVVMVPNLLSSGFSIYPNGLALFWMLIIIYLALKLYRKPSAALIFILLLFMLILVMTHTVTAAATLLLLFSFWIGSIIYGHFEKRQRSSYQASAIFLIFTLIMFGWWMYVSGNLQQLVNLIQSGFKLPDWQAPAISLAYLKQINYLEYLLDNIGVIIFYGLGIIGSFYMLSPSRRNLSCFLIVLAGFVQMFFSLICQATGILGSLSPRLFLFIQIIIAVPAAVGVLSLIGHISGRIIANVALFVAIAVMSFFLITNSVANIDNPIYNKDLVTRTALTVSELQGLDTLSNIYHGVVSAVIPEWIYLEFNKNMAVEPIDVQSLANQNFNEYSSNVVVITSQMIKHPFFVNSGVYEINYDILQVLENQGYSLFYENGSVYFLSKNTLPLTDVSGILNGN